MSATNVEVPSYPTTLTLEWLKQNDHPLYVRNITRPRGQLAVNFPQQNGRVKVIKIPRTHLPIHLSLQLSWDTIMQSDDLRACLVKGVLEIVRPDEAEAELSSEGAIAETERMQLSEFSAKHTFMSKRVREMEHTNATRVDPNSAPLEPLGIDTNVIQPRILSLIEKLQNGDISIKAGLSELKTMEDELRETDCSYVITNGPGGQIRNYMQKILAQIRSRPSEYDLTVDDPPDMTPEEKADESRREAMARHFQQV